MKIIISRQIKKKEFKKGLIPEEDLKINDGEIDIVSLPETTL